MALETIKETVAPPIAKDALASGGILSGLVALIGASCCIIPLVLFNIGLGGAWLAKLEFFVVAKPYFMIASAVFIISAFIAAFWGGRSPSRKTITILVVATVFTGFAYVMPWYEGRILRFLFG